ncbi:MAG TPA: DUF3090 family protein [Candidatus Tectomicrobia bacterium]|nr:DUF3090 family protein [Candidatus Tectomicrobia bacterium]
MSASFDLEAPDRFTAGAVGPPGQRVFYLQASEGDTLVTLKCEKDQVSALGEYLAGLLVRLGTVVEPAREDAKLVEPVEPAWTVASIGVGYDEGDDRIVIVASELIEDEREGEPASARFAITRPQAAAFVGRARTLVKAGRPTCPMCGQPRDPGGHLCPRANGHRVPTA